MSLRINTNLQALNSQRSIAVNTSKSNKSMQKLSSGQRINVAADDAAGLAISEKLKSEIRGSKMAKSNAENAISFVQVGEGALNEVNNILVRLRELGVQSASDTIGDEERGFIDTEAQQLLGEIDRISGSTKFGDKFLLNGSAENMEFQVGTDASENSRIAYDSDADATASALGVDGLEFSDKVGSRDALEILDGALSKVGGMRANFGALQNRLDSTISNLSVSHENLSAANSRIRDVDVAEESSKLASAQILQNSSVGMLAQANQAPQLALKLLG